MARPRKNPEDPRWSEGATERVIAPETVATVQPVPLQAAHVPLAPRQMRMARGGATSEPVTRSFPNVRGGICEFCGVMDSNTPSQYQYKLCPHYRGLQLWCKYCPAEKDPNEVIRATLLKVVEDPYQPGTLMAVCDRYDCQQKFQKEYKSN